MQIHNIKNYLDLDIFEISEIRIYVKKTHYIFFTWAFDIVFFF
jgi:hypothetical protein